LRELQQHVLEVAADEQRRIGQELHDGTQQQLTGLGLYASTLEKVLAQAQEVVGQEGNVWQLNEQDWQRIQQTLARLSLGLGEANRQVRALSHGIMPVQIDAEGLVSALAELINQLNQETGVRCEFSCPTTVPVANNSVATHLYRIAQEAVNNALRHGKASHLRVSLRSLSDGIELEIRDNGVGMEVRRNATAGMPTGSSRLERREADTSRLESILGRGALKDDFQSERRPRGMGLKMMNYRANLLGGQLELVSSLGNGTILRCRIPGGVIE